MIVELEVDLEGFAVKRLGLRESKPQTLDLAEIVERVCLALRGVELALKLQLRSLVTFGG